MASKLTNLAAQIFLVAIRLMITAAVNVSILDVFQQTHVHIIVLLVMQADCVRNVRPATLARLVSLNAVQDVTVW
jgi:hypothetical protein